MPPAKAKEAGRRADSVIPALVSGLKKCQPSDGRKSGSTNSVRNSSKGELSRDPRSLPLAKASGRSVVRTCPALSAAASSTAGSAAVDEGASRAMAGVRGRTTGRCGCDSTENVRSSSRVVAANHANANPQTRWNVFADTVLVKTPRPDDLFNLPGRRRQFQN